LTDGKPPVLTEGRARTATIVAMLLGLFAALELHLVPPLLAGLLVHELVHAIASRIAFATWGTSRARMLSVGLIGALVIGGLVALGFGILAFFRSEGGSPAALVIRLADILEASRRSMPQWLADLMPPDAEALRQAIVDWLRVHAKDLQVAGRTIVETLVRILIGMVIGAIICFREAKGERNQSLLLDEAGTRVQLLARAFRSVVFAQMKISAVNTTLTALYLAVALPMLGVHLPYMKSLIALTFIAGLLPVIGNLISNTVIVVVSLSHGVGLAITSLAFLVVVHKLEYFLNARIVGGEIKASAWELLCAMLVFEAAFGLPGLVAAPVFYAYFKAELRNVGWI
jgi:predicted PurR-regulated permease PerM